MTQTTTLVARRDCYREHLNHAVHNVPVAVRRELISLLSASFIAEVHGDTLDAERLLDTAAAIAARHSLDFDR